MYGHEMVRWYNCYHCLQWRSSTWHTRHGTAKQLLCGTMAYQKVSEAEEGTLLSEQSTPLTNIDGDADSSSATSRSRVLKVVGLVALASGGAAAVIR